MFNGGLGIMSELDLFIDEICQKYGYDLHSSEIIGKGYTSSIYKISDSLCMKITEKDTCPTFLMKIKNCDNLCIPIKSFTSSTGKYVGYVQRYIDSCCLQDYIAKRQSFGENDVAHIIFDVLKGLSILHKNGYVHRDFYPGNIMIHSSNSTYAAVIIDFDETQKTTDDTRACFRYSGYHAPEIVLYDDLYDEKSEIFAVGVIMWELLFGDCPFGGYSFFGRVIAKSWDDYERNSASHHQKVTDALMNLKSFVKSTEVLSVDCSDLLMKLLAEDKEERISASLAMEHDFFRGIKL